MVILELPQDILHARFIDGVREMAHPIEVRSTTFRVRWDILNKDTQWHIDDIVENIRDKAHLVSVCDSLRSDAIKKLHRAAGVSRRDKFGLKVVV